MKLYHFTDAANVEGIANRGLLPRPKLVTLWRPAVWLTASDAPEHWSPKSDSALAKRRLIVRVARSNRLAHYASWLQKQKRVVLDEFGRQRLLDGGEPYSTDHLLAALPPSAKADWYVYFGIIPANKIEF
jgi:hypothetical protein